MYKVKGHLLDDGEFIVPLGEYRIIEDVGSGLRGKASTFCTGVDELGNWVGLFNPAVLDFLSNKLLVYGPLFRQHVYVFLN